MAVSLREKMLFIEAFFFQFTVGLLLMVIPFKLIPRLFANHSPHTSHASRLTPHPSPLNEIKRVTQRTIRLSPWKNKCLVQSLAARWMLNLRKIQSQLSLGVILDNNKKMIAHAWLKAGDFEVVEQGGDYQELYKF